MSFAVLTFEIKFICFKIYHRSHTPYFIKLLSAYRITLESIFYFKKKIKIFHYSLKKGDLGSKQLSQTISVWAAMVTLLIWLQLKHTKEQEQFIKLIFQPEKSKRPLNCDFHLIAFAVLKLRTSSLQQNKPFFFFLIRIPEALFHFPAKGMQAWLGRKALHSLANLCFIVGGVKG